MAAGICAVLPRPLESVGAEVRLTSNAKDLAGAESLVVPGVGAFGDCAKRLQEAGLWKEIRAWLDADRPYLGICLGYQLLFESSEENPGVDGLGFFRGKVRRFAGEGLKVPHMGWNTLEFKKKSVLFESLDSGAYAYFVHSYHPCPEEDITTSTTSYGGGFAASIERGRVFATQFHPEKSQSVGLRILQNFVKVE